MFSIIKQSFFILSILIVFTGQSQNLETYNDETYSRIAFQLNSVDKTFHTAIKPFSTKEIDEIFTSDSNLTIPIKHTFFNCVLNSNLVEKNTEKLRLKINPIISSFSLYSPYQQKFLFQTKLGLSLGAIYRNKYALQVGYAYSNYQFPDYVKSKIDTMHVIPYYGTFEKKANDAYTFDNISFHISSKAGKYFNYKVGRGKNFWGDGYRSLILSDNSNNYPYAQLNLKIWNIKYVVLYSFLRDINYPDTYYKLENKYSTSHLLSWNIVSWLNIGLFESVIWNGGETSGNRGFEINYLNPVIFFRPVEFSLDDPSPDNVLMGLFYRIKLSSNFINYGQIVLDDFNFSEFRKRIGYWGNKYGFQSGFYLFNIFNISQLSTQAEFNMVSPFTYSHVSSLDNYGHYYQPLAHPLGSNFIELFSRIQYYIGRFGVISKIIFAKTGSDENENNVGQNIYRPYGDRQSDYGYKLLNGIQNNYQIIDLKCSYLVNPKWNLKLELGFIYRMHEINNSKSKSSFITFGIKTPVGSEEYYY